MCCLVKQVADAIALPLDVPEEEHEHGLKVVIKNVLEVELCILSHILIVLIT